MLFDKHTFSSNGKGRPNSSIILDLDLARLRRISKFSIVELYCFCGQNSGELASHG